MGWRAILNTDLEPTNHGLRAEEMFLIGPDRAVGYLWSHKGPTQTAPRIWIRTRMNGVLVEMHFAANERELAARRLCALIGAEYLPCPPFNQVFSDMIEEEKRRKKAVKKTTAPVPAGTAGATRVAEDARDAEDAP